MSSDMDELRAVEERLQRERDEASERVGGAGPRRCVCQYQGQTYLGVSRHLIIYPSAARWCFPVNYPCSASV
jgi:hypothetical protein